MVDTNIRQHYQALLTQYGDTHESAQYSSAESQEARYAILLGVGDLSGKKVLDFGCGTGHLATYMNKNNIQCAYTGVDIVNEFFPLARAKHPQHRFGLWDDFQGEEFDYALVSGVFNNRMQDNSGFFEISIRRLFSCVREGLAFNLMSTYVDYQDKGLWYVAPEYAFGFIKSLTPYVTLRNDYVVKETPVPFEFAIYAYRHPFSL